MEFDAIFSSRRLVTRHRTGPLAPERLAYLRHRSDQGMARATLGEFARYLLAIAHHLRLAERSGERIGIAEVTRTTARWARRQRRPRPARIAFQSLAVRWLKFVGRLDEGPAVPRPFAAAVAAYADDMRDERGLSPVTIDKRCWWVQYFLQRLPIPGGCLDRVTIALIDDTFLTLVADNRLTRATLNVRARGLRSFFAFAERRGWCRPGLAHAIHVPRLYDLESLPSGPSWEQVQSTLRMCRGDRPVDLRAEAMLRLFSTYALRAREVARLRLDDLDWVGERLTIAAGKTGRTRTYPLTRATGDAIVRYLKEARPHSSHREVFLTVRAPVRPLTGAGVYGVVAAHTRRLGVPLPEYGPRSLRHACATHLLNDGGLSMKEVADHLGHRDLDSTQIYAKVHLVGLRAVADLDLGGDLCDCTPS